MTASYTSRLRLVKQGDGDNPNTWGTVLNDGMISLVDDAIAGYTTVELGAAATVTLSAVDGVLNMTPGFTHQRNVAALVTSRRIDKIEKPFKPGRKTVQEWLNITANHQFTIQEIEDGIAYDTLKVQYQSAG